MIKMFRTVPSPIALSSAALLAVSACTSTDPPPATLDLPAPTVIDNPTAMGSAEPHLAIGSGGAVHLSWVEPVDDGHRVAVATLTPDGSWSAPLTAVAAGDLFVNWADFPSVIELRGGGFAAHWLQSLGEASLAYGVRVAQTGADGTWQTSRQVHDDASPTEHGFVSLVPEPDGGFTAVWLDGRAFANTDLDPHSGSADMSLRARRYGADGSAGPEQLLDDRTCDCCQTTAAYLGDTLVVAYRDRSPAEVRDIWTVRRTADGWDEPTPIAADHWTIPGCPVNGPVLVSTGGVSGAVAWFSLVDERPEVKVAFSSDGGTKFGDPLLVERGTADVATLGRVGLASLGDGSVVATWLSQVGNAGEIRYRRVAPDGELGPVATLASTGAGRNSGFPGVVATPSRLVFAWTDPRGGEPVIRTAVMALPATAN